MEKMNSYQDYRIKFQTNSLKSYIFDRVTSLFIKSKWHQIKNPKKILIVRNDHIGDMALSTPVFRELKRAFPKSKITVLANPASKVLIEKDPNVDEILEIDLFWRRKNYKAFKDYKKILKKLKEENFDVGIALRKSKLAILFFLYLPKIKSRITYYNVNGGKAFLTHPIYYDRKINVVNELIQLLNKTFNLNIQNFWPHISTDKVDEAEVNDFIKQNKLGKYIILCPGATVIKKKWPEKKYAELIRMFHKKYPKHKIVIAGGPDEKDLLENLSSVEKSVCLPTPGFNLRKFSILTKKAEAVVANNGGVRDIAWLSGAKVVALESQLNLEINVSLKNTITIHQIPNGFDKNSKESYWQQGRIEAISAEETMKAVEELMQKKVPKNGFFRTKIWLNDNKVIEYIPNAKGVYTTTKVKNR